MNNSNEHNKMRSNQENYLDFYRMKIEKLVYKKLILRYEKPLSFYDIKIVNDMIFNEKTHFVEIFKEFLLYDDYNEFLKRFYNIKEISNKLPLILNFYEKYSKIYANYTVIPERKYMYKNIKRKQKIIDQMQNNFNDDLMEDNEIDKNLNSTIFNSQEMSSINSFSMTINSYNSKINTTQTDNGAIELINKIDYFEKEALKLRNYIKKQINIPNKLINNNNKNQNQNDTIKDKLQIDKRIKSKIKIKLLEKKKLNLFSLNNSKSNNKISFNDTSKNDKKITLSTNNNSPILKKISPVSSNIIKKKNILMKSQLNFKKENIQLNTLKYNNSKLFLNKKIDKIKNNLNSLINKTSKSISKDKNNPKYENKITNNIHKGIARTNNHTGKVFLNANFHSSKNIFKKQPIYFNKNIITNDNSFNNINNYSNKKISKLNLRKLFRKKILGLESLSDRQTNNNKKWFDRNHYFHKNNISNNEIYSNSSNIFFINDNSKIMNKQSSYIFNLTNLNPNRVIKTNNNNNNNLSNINIKRMNSNINLEDKFKLKNFNKLANKKI